MEKNKITSGNSGKIAAGAYLKKGGKVTGKKKMGTGGAAGKVQVKSPNKAAAVSPKMKGGGMYKMGGKKGM